MPLEPASPGCPGISSARQGVALNSQADETRELAVDFVQKCSREERMLLIQKEVEGLTVEELSEQTGINENTIKVKLFRARQKLQKAAAKLDRAVA